MANPVIGVRLPERLAEKIHAEAARRGQSDSALVREIIAEYFVADASITQRLAEQIVGRLSQAVVRSVKDAWGTAELSALGGALAWSVLSAMQVPNDRANDIVVSVQSALSQRGG